jgi:hypothetical protein
MFFNFAMSSAVHRRNVGFGIGLAPSVTLKLKNAGIWEKFRRIRGPELPYF